MTQAQRSSVIYQPGNVKCLASSQFAYVCACVHTCAICLCMKTIEGIAGSQVYWRGQVYSESLGWRSGRGWWGQ